MNLSFTWIFFCKHGVCLVCAHARTHTHTDKNVKYFELLQARSKPCPKAVASLVCNKGPKSTGCFLQGARRTWGTASLEGLSVAPACVPLKSQQPTQERPHQGGNGKAPVYSQATLNPGQAGKGPRSAQPTPPTSPALPSQGLHEVPLSATTGRPGTGLSLQQAAAQPPSSHYHGLLSCGHSGVCLSRRAPSPTTQAQMVRELQLGKGEM